MRPERWRRLFKPRYAEMFRRAHAALAFIRRLYEIEKRAKDMASTDRARLRQAGRHQRQADQRAQQHARPWAHFCEPPGKSAPGALGGPGERASS